MKTTLCILLLFFQICAYPQRINADLYVGVSNYQGDLQAKRFTFSDAKSAFGLGLSYYITNKVIIRGVASYLKVSGKDRPGIPAYDFFDRNSNFESNILEAQLAVEYNLYDLEERSFTPYAFAGVAAFHFSPYTFDKTGKKEFLRPFATEGQGLPQYPDKKLYKNKQIAIPFGGGVKFVLSDRIQMGVEIGLRKLFTDYLDDVSGTYADSSILASARGPQAAALAYRGSEIKGYVPYPEEGSIRGNPKSKDWYYTTGLKISYSFGSFGGNGTSSSRKSKTGCPSNVY